MRRKNRLMAGLMSFILCLSGMSKLPVYAAKAVQITASQTITIGTVREFEDFRKSCNAQRSTEGKTIVLQEDLDLTGLEFQPIPLFCGVFDGNGHTIRGIRIQNSGSDLGLFRYIEEGAVVRNLHAEGVIEPSGSSEHIGGIAGVNRGRIENCSFQGTVTGKKATGGIAGHNEATGQIENCQNHASVTGRSMTGGIVGYQEGTILTCTNQGAVNTMPENILESDESQETLSLDHDKLMEILREEKVQDTGGIAGMSEGIIQECTNLGQIGYERMGDYTGGIAGRQNGQVIRCTNESPVSGRRYVGGIAGQLEPYLQLLYESDTLDQLELQMDLLSDIQDALSDSIRQTTDQTSDHMDQVNGLSDEIRDITKERKNDLKSKRDVFREEADGYLDTLKEIIDDMELDLSSRSARNAASRIRKNISRFKTLLKELGGVEAEIPGINLTPGIATASDAAQIAAETEYSYWIPDEDGNELTGALAEEWMQSYNIVKELAGCAGSIMQDIEIVLFDGSEGVEDGLQDFADDLDSLRYEGRGLSDLVRNYLDQLLDDMDGLDDELTAKMDDLAEEGDAISDVLKNGKDSLREETDRLDALLDQIDQTIKDGKDRVRKYADDFLDEENLFEDISDETWQELSNGMITECYNQGIITGDTESGGIVGSIGLKMLEDLKDRMSIDEDRSLNLLKKAKAAVVDCQNDGSIYTRYNYAGGIAGNMNLGTLTGCSNYGMIQSKEGDYVGGIAGYSEHVIRSSYSMCNIYGGSNIGGIVGYGTHLHDNCAMTWIHSEDGERLGSIAGSADTDGLITGNIYVEEGLGAVDGISYTAEANGISYQELLKLPKLPNEFYQLTVTFLCDDEIIKTIRCSYGDSISTDQFPELPQKDGFYYAWEDLDLGSVRSNLQIHAVSRPWTTVISTEEEPLARMLASGNFYPDAVLKIQRTDLVPEKISGYRTIDSLFYEIWQNSDSLYQEESVLRILAKDYSQQAVVGILSEGGIQLVDCRRDGDYLVFSGPGSGNLIILEPVRIHAIWIGAVGILVIIWFLWKKESKQNKVKE